MTEPYYSRENIIYNGEGVLNLPFPFDYINKEHIIIVINDDVENYISSNSFTWYNDHTITLDTTNIVDITGDEVTLSVGDEISIRRSTPLNESMVVFTDGNILDEETQNIARLQVLYSTREIWDSQQWLLAQMQAFIDLSDKINDALSQLNTIAQTAEDAYDLLTKSQEVLADVTDTEQDIQNKLKIGFTTTNPRKLFETCYFDRELTGEELDGMGKEGTVFSIEDYPTAYETILFERNNGVAKALENEEATASALKHVTETTGTIYTAENTPLDDGVEVFSDIYNLSSLGNVTSYETKTRHHYIGEDTGDFYSDEEIKDNEPVYTENDELIGQVSKVKSVLSYKYTLSTTGTVYTEKVISKETKSQPIYSDPARKQYIGSLTNYKTVQSDKYTIKGAAFSTFYVPKDTVVTGGTQLYADAGCTVKLAKVTKKGTTTSSTSYCYKVINSTIIVGTNTLKPNQLFYTKTKVPTKTGDVNIPIYTNKACTTRIGLKNYRGEALNNINVENVLSHIEGNTYLYKIANSMNEVTYISTSPASTSTYYQIGTSTTKCTISKQGTVSADVVNVENGANQSFTSLGGDTYRYVTIGSGDEEGFTYQGIDRKTIIAIDNGEPEIVISQDELVSDAGVSFIYYEYSNGHKIVDSMYEDALAAYQIERGNCPFYMINQEDGTVKLPQLMYPDNLGLFYLCLGSTVVAPSAINGVTKAYLDSVLEQYLTKDALNVANLNFLSAFPTVISPPWAYQGEPTIIDNQFVTDFSANSFVYNYMKQAIEPYETGKVEITLVTGDDVNTKQGIIGLQNIDNQFAICIENGQWLLINKLWGVHESLCTTRVGSVQKNTSYHLVIDVNNGWLSFYLDTDIENEPLAEVTISRPLTMILGAGYTYDTGVYGFKGTIDTSNSAYINMYIDPIEPEQPDIYTTTLLDTVVTEHIEGSVEDDLDDEE